MVLPISFFEKSGQAYFNSLRVIDCDGTVLAGTYRKSHIPDGPGYQEKFYFSPGDSGFRVWGSKLGVRIGVAVCWDMESLEQAAVTHTHGMHTYHYVGLSGSTCAFDRQR